MASILFYAHARLNRSDCCTDAERQLAATRPTRVAQNGDSRYSTASVQMQGGTGARKPPAGLRKPCRGRSLRVSALVSVQSQAGSLFGPPDTTMQEKRLP